jgi:MATE family multidrug resistance protein
VVAFYVFALPVALFLGFYMQLGVLGLFSGMGLGPLVQTLLYGALVARMDWGREAARAAALAMKEEAAVLERRLLEAASSVGRLRLNGQGSGPDEDELPELLPISPGEPPPLRRLSSDERPS